MSTQQIAIKYNECPHEALLVYSMFKIRSIRDSGNDHSIK
jgi:hypothetical protein